MADETIRIIVLTQGADQAAKDISSIGNSASKSDDQSASLLNTLKGFIAVSAISGLVSEFADLADSVTTVHNRLLTLTGSTTIAGAAFTDIQSIADNTRTSLDGTADTFVRLSGAAQGLGVSYQSLLNITQTINEAAQISGVSASQTNGAIVGLLTNLDRGSLTARNLITTFRSVPALAQALETQFNAAGGALKNLGANGDISAKQVLTAFQNFAPTIQSQFDAITPTIGSTFTVLGNEIEVAVDNLNNFTGAGNLAKNGIRDLAADIASLTTVAEDLGTVFGNAFKQINDWIIGMQGAAKSSDFTFNNFLKDTAYIIDSTAGLFVGLWDAVEQGCALTVLNLNQKFVDFENTVKTSFASVINSIIDDVNSLGSYISGPQFQHVGVTLEKSILETNPELAKQAGKSIGDAFMEGFNSVNGAEDYVKGVLNKSANLGQYAPTTQPSVLSTTSPGQGLPPNLPQDTHFESILKSLQAEAAALNTVNTNRQTSIRLTQIENSLEEGTTGVQLTDLQKQSLANELQEIQYLTEKNQIIQTVTGNLHDNAEQQTIVNQLIAQGGDDTDKYTAYLRQLEIQALSTSTSIGDGFKRGFLQAQQSANDFATDSAKVVTDAFDGFSQSISDFVTTGKLSFSSLVDSILGDLTKLILKQTIEAPILNLLSSFIPGLNLVGGATGTPHAAGGPVTAGTSYLVGERGPEMFTPQQSGNIQASGGNSSAPIINVTNVNVTDTDGLRDAILNNSKADKIIVNKIGQNRSAVKTVLS